MQAPDRSTLKRKLDYAILALLVGSLFEEKTRNRILSTLSPC
jgi:hypothetical protein